MYVLINELYQESLLEEGICLRFGHSDAVFDLSIETRFLNLIILLSNF